MFSLLCSWVCWRVLLIYLTPKQRMVSFYEHCGGCWTPWYFCRPSQASANRAVYGRNPTNRLLSKDLAKHPKTSKHIIPRSWPKFVHQKHPCFFWDRRSVLTSIARWIHSKFLQSLDLNGVQRCRDLTV